MATRQDLREDEDRCIERQGWSEHTMLNLMERFIAEQGLDGEFHEFLVEIAREAEAEEGY